MGNPCADFLNNLYDQDSQNYADPDNIVVETLVSVGDGDLAESAAADRPCHRGIPEYGNHVPTSGKAAENSAKSCAVKMSPL